jgi:hypothetical protein
MHRTCAAGLAATIALAGIGCGASSKPLTRAELVARADAVCTRLQHQGQALSRSATATFIHDRSSKARLIRELYPKIEADRKRALSDLSALDPPDASKAAFTGFMAAMRTGAAMLPSAADAAAGRDPHQAQRHVVQQRESRLAADLGFRSCN